MFEQAFKNIDDVLWKDAGCNSELDYTGAFFAIATGLWVWTLPETKGTRIHAAGMEREERDATAR